MLESRVKALLLINANHAVLNIATDYGHISRKLKLFTQTSYTIA